MGNAFIFHYSRAWVVNMLIWSRLATNLSPPYRHAFEIMRLRRVEVEKNAEIWNVVFNRQSRRRCCSERLVAKRDHISMSTTHALFSRWQHALKTLTTCFKVMFVSRTFDTDIETKVDKKFLSTHVQYTWIWRKRTFHLWVTLQYNAIQFHFDPKKSCSKNLGEQDLHNALLFLL